MRKQSAIRRRGNIVVLSAVALIGILGLMALAIDLGVVYQARNHLQKGVDAGVLAGTGRIPEGFPFARKTALEYVQMNQLEDVKSNDFDAVFGRWDYTSRTFIEGESPYDAMRLTIQHNDRPMFFGRVFNKNSFDVEATATAAIRPRDIMLVLDFSGSMNSHGKLDQLKEAVELFLSTIGDSGAIDRVGFVRYSTKGEMEEPLTFDLASVEQAVMDLKATGFTNIGEGMTLARQELEQNARRQALPMMVIMTDGNVNRPKGRDPKEYVLDEAELAADAGIGMVTVSFGSDADKGLMEEVAEIADGSYHHADGGVNDTELKAIFYKIATQRPVILVD